MIKPIALYLPQFHPIPENDKWWGPGFTEWTNVTKATPRFEGHYQPHLPADLGFYDLRLEESRLAQEALAKEYGIHGFCYYHYWFNGKRLLHEPLDRKLRDTKENLPFMLCWANENWTKAWDGRSGEVILRQDYHAGDDLQHVRYLCENIFPDSRYIRAGGKPVFIFYRPRLFPDIKKTLDIWREEAMRSGIGELYLGYFQSFNYKEKPGAIGFDFGAEFQPDFSNIKSLTFADKIQNYVSSKLHPDDKDCIIDYKEFSEHQCKTRFQDGIFPGITPMWDNSPRRSKNAYIFQDSTPEKYGRWLSHIINNYPWENSDADFLFINAWNEWAEGNHLEPCQKWGRQYLEVTRECLAGKK